ncbi:adenosylcobinamide-GDP ribazoletransferase [Clostridium boliviensis]|uniref:Adenosylcobinamide-GDP ribazoletransferase n=1 Tax=Clostridium boliviensis TaxID=318465 RepID=A0ABU4GN42_9CLOT|nr:adenosylcobinamide-GDP ribazoletransferase [Clostridium boliviensis]MDW2799046.1 adenosylcobinamide-GDP ribazoletransferase [Clostridium boliviensis]
MNLTGSMMIAFSMYSRIPVLQVQWTKERMKYAMCFFPLIGAIIGLLEYGAILLFRTLGFPFLEQIMPVIIPVVVTGGIHMDGLLDVIDAKSSHGETEKKLEILKDPHTGAFAIIGCGVYFLLYLAFFMEMKPAMIPAYCITFVITRALSGLSVVTFPMAKKSGLAAAFSDGAHKRVVGTVMVLYLVITLMGLWILAGTGGLLAVSALSFLVFLYYYRMAKREFGGITGDLAGYFLQILELVLVMVLAVLSHMNI